MKKHWTVSGIPVEQGSGNVYADLGYPDSETMLVKAQLAAKIAETRHEPDLDFPVAPGAQPYLKVCVAEFE